MLKYLIEKEFKQFIRNPFIPKLVIILPIIVMLVFPWATTMEIKNINIALLDHDKGPTAQQLIQKVVSSGYFNISEVCSSYEQAIESIEYKKSDLILEIPSGFENHLIDGNPSQVLISANAVNATKANVGISYLSSIINEYSIMLLGNSKGDSAGESIEIMPSFRYNPTDDYKIPMLPALMVLLLTLICGFLPALNVVMEKETGTIEQINVSPIPKHIFIMGKLIPYWTIGFTVFSLAIIISYLIYGLIPVGNILLIYCTALLYIFTISGLGMIISNYSTTLQQAMFTIFFFIIIMILISGLFTPLASMPLWAQITARLSPLTYFVEIMRNVFLKGATIKDILPQIAALLGFFALLTTWAIKSYKK